MKALVMHNKKREVGYAPWQRQLEEYFNSLTIVRRELTDVDKKMYLLDLIATDTRYRTETNDCGDDDMITYFESCGRMMHRATRCKNLTTDTTKREGNHAETPEANLGETKTNPGGKGGKGGKDKTKDHKSGSEKTDATIKEERAKMICERYLYGKCTYKDACHFKHADLNKITKPNGRGSGKKGDGRGRGKGDGRGRGRGGGRGKDGELLTCFSYDETGKCARGDTCHFAHVAADEKKSADT
jgi:hypothetical protein